MNADTLNKFLQIDFNSASEFLQNVLRNPTSNVTAFALILGLVTIFTLIIVLVLLLVFMSSSEDDEEYDEDEVDGAAASQIAAAAAAKAEAEALAAVPLTPEELRQQRIKRYIGALIWLVVVGIVWMAGGYVTSSDTLCLSCHGSTIHTTRARAMKGDAHQDVNCVSCHESANKVANLTTGVPGRAIHFITGIGMQAQARDYGIPVKNKNCAACHQKAITGVYADDVRGLRVSHAEPLASQALCTDCHKPRPLTGEINRFTVGMDPCLRCHDNTKASAECAVCHTKDVGLAVQSRGTFQPVRHAAELDCGGCHSQKTCDACHGIRMPHTAAFRGAGHARAGVEDLWFNGGKTCGKCHTPTRRPCTKCHNTMPSHGVDYMPTGHQNADPFNNGCDQCHAQRAWIVGRNYCGLCHPKWEKYNTKLNQ